MQIGLTTFVETTPDPATGRTQRAEERLRDLLEEIELAEQVGLDVYGVGEHHRPDFVASAPAVVLAAAAARTQRIRLTSAVTVLSSDDPIRVFQAFAEVDLISGGRAEIMAGRGSFTESFPLFGLDLADYDRLYAEKLERLLAIRADHAGHGVWPAPVQDPLPVWVAVGGTPQSVVRAATLGLPMALAIIGGQPERFVPLVQLYREAARRAGRDPAALRLGINSHGFVADTTEAAVEAALPPYLDVMGRLGRERGWAPPSRRQFDAERGPGGALLVGDPEAFAAKILWEHELFAHDRFLVQLTLGTMPHAQVLRAIELYGTRVAPIVREEVARRTASAQGAPA